MLQRDVPEKTSEFHHCKQKENVLASAGLAEKGSEVLILTSLCKVGIGSTIRTEAVLDTSTLATLHTLNHSTNRAPSKRYQ